VEPSERVHARHDRPRANESGAGERAVIDIDPKRPGRAGLARIVVSPGTMVQSTEVYHVHLPELRAEGPSPEAAAKHLADRLVAELDSVSSSWRRLTVERCLVDLYAFIDTDHRRLARS